MSYKLSFGFVIAVAASLLSGCNIASGDHSKIVQAGSGSKAAGDQQDVPSELELARVQEEARLATERARLAEERAELEKQKREFAEEQLKSQEENKTAKQQPQGEASQARSDAGTPVTRPRAMAALPPRRRNTRPYRYTPRNDPPEEADEEEVIADEEGEGEECTCPEPEYKDAIQIAVNIF